MAKQFPTDVLMLTTADDGPRDPKQCRLGVFHTTENSDTARPEDIAALEGVDHLFIEGGAETAAAFLRADLVDRLLLYRAPILVGAGMAALGDIGLARLGDAHGRWRLIDSRMLGSDRMEVYEAAS